MTEIIWVHPIWWKTVVGKIKYTLGSILWTFYRRGHWCQCTVSTFSNSFHSWDWWRIIRVQMFLILLNSVSLVQSSELPDLAASIHPIYRYCCLLNGDYFAMAPSTTKFLSIYSISKSCIAFQRKLHSWEFWDVQVLNYYIDQGWFIYGMNDSEERE